MLADAIWAKTYQQGHTTTIGHRTSTNTYAREDAVGGRNVTVKQRSGRQMIAKDDNFNTSFTEKVDKSIRKFEPEQMPLRAEKHQ